MLGQAPAWIRREDDSPGFELLSRVDRLLAEAHHLERLAGVLGPVVILQQRQFSLLSGNGPDAPAPSNVTPLMPRLGKKGRTGGRNGVTSDQLRCVRCYLRVSTEEQVMSGYSLDAQRQRLEDELVRRGWRGVGWYVEEGRSAKDTNRPELQRMLEELQPGEIVLVMKLDRLTRSVRDLDDLLRVFDGKQVLFQSANENFETVTASGRLFVRLVAEIAQWEREVIAERSAMGLRQKVESGEWQGGPVPFGYQAVPSGKLKGKKELLKLIPDPSVSHIIPEVFERYLSGTGVRGICRWLNEQRRVSTKNGALWRSSSLIRTLTNPIYAGYVQHGARSKHQDYEPIWRRGAHEPLVSEATFTDVQTMYEAREGTAPRHATGQYPLTGIAFCGVCGGKVHVVPRKHQGSYSYRCGNYANGTGCGDGTQRPLTAAAGQVVENNLLRAIEELATVEGLDQYASRFDGAMTDGAQAAEAEAHRLEDQIARARTAIKRWDEAFEESQGSTNRMRYDDYTEKVEPHREKIRQAETDLADAKKKPAPPDREALAIQAVNIRTVWEHLQPPERKALLQRFCRALRVQIRVFPDRRVELVPAPVK